MTDVAKAETTTVLRPRYEGSNICTWIGFKHVNYLVEEAVLEHLRQTCGPARELYERYAACVDIVSIDTRIGHAFHMDDEVEAAVAPARKSRDGQLTLAVTLRVRRNGEPLKAATSTVAVALRVDDKSGPAEPLPADLARFAVPVIAGAGLDPITADGPHEKQLAGDGNAFVWKWRIPYFYCHFTERMQMNGYLRQMEEVVDLFLADRNVSIKRLLDEQNWIPVVPRSEITMVGEALMEEDLYTVFTVEEVFKDVTYTARMDCFVLRDGVYVPTATGRITHGYAVIENRRDWSLVDFDARMSAALRNEGS